MINNSETLGDTSARRSRRWFLGAAAASLVAISCSSENDAPVEPRSIAIVGAGMAGLAAGRALHDAGHQVTIFDGRDRIGGRTHTGVVGAATLDLGGAWIHGPEENPIAEFATARGVAFSPHSTDPDFVYDAITDQRLGQADLIEPYLEAEAFQDDAGDLLDELGADASLAQALDAYFADYDDPELARRARGLVEMLTSDIGGPNDRISFDQLVNPQDEDYGGGDHIVVGGYGVLVDLLAAGLVIETSSSVTSIDTSGQRPQLQVVDRADPVVVDHVIVTVPLGVLQAGSIRFVPPLPETKVDAIARLGMNVFEKIVLVFDQRFWADDAEAGFAYLGGLGADLAFPGFYDVTEFAGAPTLVALYSGDFALSLAGRSAQERVVMCLDALREIFPDAPEPAASHATSWADDPFAGGSYSYYPIGASYEQTEALAEPVGEGLLFAGEATSVEAYATVHGAFMSGLREARRIDPSATVR